MTKDKSKEFVDYLIPTTESEDDLKLKAILLDISLHIDTEENLIKERTNA